jgi:hypothetical protein
MIGASSEGKASFCEQKEAKKLYDFGPGLRQRHGLKVEEGFAPLFSKSGISFCSNHQASAGHHAKKHHN